MPLNILNNHKKEVVDLALRAFEVHELQITDVSPLYLWAKTILVNFFLKDEIFYVEIELKYLLSHELPLWAQKAIAAKKPIHNLSIARVMEWLINNQGVADWWRHLEPNDPHLKHWCKVSVPQAQELSREWHERLARKRIEDSGEDPNGIVKNCDLPDNHYAVKIISEKALIREGAILGHCVAGYWKSVESGQCAIYSIRDHKNIPHVTIEVMRQSIRQIAGTANSRPTKYVAQIKAFFKQNDFIIGRYAEEYGIIQICKNYYETPDEFIKDARRIWNYVSINGHIVDLPEFAQVRKFLAHHLVDMTVDQQFAAFAPLLDQKPTIHVVYKGLIKELDLKEATIKAASSVLSLYSAFKHFQIRHQLLDYLVKYAEKIIYKIEGDHNIFYDLGGLRTEYGRYNNLLFEITNLEDKLARARASAASTQIISIKNAKLNLRRQINGYERFSMNDATKRSLVHALQTDLPHLEGQLDQIRAEGLRYGDRTESQPRSEHDQLSEADRGNWRLRD